jgi:hypothetical protein
MRRSRSTSTFKEEYWYSTFLKVVPFYARAELLHTPKQSDAPGHHAGMVQVGEECCQREQEGGTSDEKEKERSPMDSSTRGTDTSETMPRMLKRAVVFVIARKDERVCVCVFQYKCPPRDKRCPYPESNLPIRLENSFGCKPHSSFANIWNTSPLKREKEKMRNERLFNESTMSDK